MKKFSKSAKIFSIACSAIFSFLTLAGCGKTEQVAYNAPVVSNVAQLNSDQNNNDQVIEVSSTENETKSAETNYIYGVYKYDPITFDNASFDNLDELLKYFETKDINGVYDAVNELGFKNFVNSITNLGENNICLYFNEVIDDEGNYYYKKLVEISNKEYIENNAISNILYTYSISDNKYICGDEDPTIEFDNESKIITLTYQFKYVDENDEVVKTPLYLKATLRLVEGTEHISPAEINSILLKANNESHISILDNSDNIEDSVKTIATSLKIDVENKATTEILSDISKHFDDLLLIFSDDYNVLLITNTITKTITIINNNNQYFNYNGLNFKITSINNIIAETGVHTLELTTTVNNISYVLTFNETV